MQNLALLTDFYQLSMMQGYFFAKKDEVAVFDVYFSQAPERRRLCDILRSKRGRGLYRKS